MTVSLEVFKNNTLGGSYGKPRLDFVGDGWYVGECVSYVRQYMEQVQGVRSETAGHAVSYFKSQYMLKFYDQVTDGSRQDGDILVWADDRGNMTGPEGHIAIAYQQRILNQNYGGSRKVSINDFFAPGYLGALRRKGGDMPITTAQQDKTIKAFLEREPREDELNNQEWQTNPGLLIETLWENGGKQLYANRVSAGDIVNFMRAVYKLDVDKPEVQEEARTLALLGWKDAMYALAARYQETVIRKDQAQTKFKKVEVYVPDETK